MPNLFDDIPSPNGKFRLRLNPIPNDGPCLGLPDGRMVPLGLNPGQGWIAGVVNDRGHAIVSDGGQTLFFFTPEAKLFKVQLPAMWASFALEPAGLTLFVGTAVSGNPDQGAFLLGFLLEERKGLFVQEFPFGPLAPITIDREGKEPVLLVGKPYRPRLGDKPYRWKISFAGKLLEGDQLKIRQG